MPWMAGCIFAEFMTWLYGAPNTSGYSQSLLMVAYNLHLYAYQVQIADQCMHFSLRLHWRCIQRINQFLSAWIMFGSKTWYIAWPLTVLADLEIFKHKWLKPSLGFNLRWRFGLSVWSFVTKDWLNMIEMNEIPFNYCYFAADYNIE